MLPVTLSEKRELLVEDEPIGRVDGFCFSVDPSANHENRKMLLAAGEKALPRILAQRAKELAASGFESVLLEKGSVRWEGRRLARLTIGDNPSRPELTPERELDSLAPKDRDTFLAALRAWLATQLEPLAPLAKLEEAARDPKAGSEARALLLSLIAGRGYASRAKAGIVHLPKELRPFLRRLGVTFGALDIFVPALLKPAPRGLLKAIGADRRPLEDTMRAVIEAEGKLPSGYRPAGKKAIRVDVAEKLLRAAFDAREKAKKRRFRIDPALAVSTGLTEDDWARLIGGAGFRRHRGRRLAEDAFGPPTPDSWEWRPSRRKEQRQKGKPAPKPDNAFAALADLKL